MSLHLHIGEVKRSVQVSRLASYFGSGVPLNICVSYGRLTNIHMRPHSSLRYKKRSLDTDDMDCLRG